MTEPLIKVEEDDGQWTFLSGIGKVRSGPRGSRYWERNDHTNPAPSSPSLIGRHGGNEQQVTTPGVGHDEHHCSSISSGNLGDDEASIIKVEESLADSLTSFNYMEQLSQMFRENHRRKDPGSSAITQSQVEHLGYEDERRGHSHLPARKRTRERAMEDERGSPLFLSENPSTFTTPSSPTFSDEHDRMKRQRFDSETPSPPSTPPMIECALPDRGCRCPVGFACPTKDNLKSDCRTLTIEYRRWQIRGRQLAVEE